MSIQSRDSEDSLTVGWLVGYLGFKGPLRDSISVNIGLSPREGERKEKVDERKMSKQPQPAPIASAIGPCPTFIQISRTPRH